MTQFTATQPTSFFPSVLKFFVAVCAWPIDALRAQEQLNKFRALDTVALSDLGLSVADINSASLGDFMPKSRR